MRDRAGEEEVDPDQERFAFLRDEVFMAAEVYVGSDSIRCPIYYTSVAHALS